MAPCPAIGDLRLLESRLELKARQLKRFGWRELYISEICWLGSISGKEERSPAGGMILT